MTNKNFIVIPKNAEMVYPPSRFYKLLDLLNGFERVLFIDIGFAHERPDLEKLRESYFTLRGEVLKNLNLSPEDAETP